MVLLNCVWDFWNFQNLNFNDFSSLYKHGTQWEWKFQNPIPPINRSRKFSAWNWFSSQWSSQNCVWDFWNFEFPIFNDLFSKIQFTIVPYGKPYNREKLATRGQFFNIVCPSGVEGHFGVIRCTCNFAKIWFFKILLLIYL